MLNVHRGLAPKWEDLSFTRKSLILLLFPVLGPLAVVAAILFVVGWLAFAFVGNTYESFLSIYNKERHGSQKT